MSQNGFKSKIKLIPPVVSHSIILLVLTLSNYAVAAFSRHLFWVVWSAQIAVSGLFEGLGLTCPGKNWWFSGGQPDNVGQTIIVLILLLYIILLATKEPAQPCNLISGLQSWCASILNSNPCPPPTPLWALVMLLHLYCSDFLSYLVGNSTSSYKYYVSGNRFRTCAGHPWQVMLAWIL